MKRLTLIAALALLMTAASAAEVHKITWLPSPAPDLEIAPYRVYQMGTDTLTTPSIASAQWVHVARTTDTQATVETLPAKTHAWYTVTAKDTSGNESVKSVPVVALDREAPPRVGGVAVRKIAITIE